MATIIISEVMYDPASVEDDWEWVELYNNGGSTIDLSGYVIDDINSIAHGSANIASGSIAAGQTAILYNADDVVAGDFTAAWGTGINLVPVTNWNAMALNNVGDTVGIWDSFANYSGDNTTHANALVSIAYDNGATWPTTNNSASIFLSDVSADASDGSNWVLSTDGANTPAGGAAYTSQAQGGNSGNDIGSPGGTVPAGTTLAIAATDANKLEGDSGTTDFTFTVTRSGDTSGTTTVDFATADGTAVAGDDYTSSSGTLTFNATETTKTITVDVLGDTTAESAETLTVTLSNASGGATITTAAANGTIQNDDSTTTLEIAATDANKLEGDSGTTDFTFTVTRSGDTSGTTTVDFATADGTAVAGDDYTSSSGTLTFNATETTKTITVDVTGDTTAESAETLTVTLSNASGGATITTAAANGTIQNDDSTTPSPSLPPPAPDPDPMIGGLNSPTIPPPPPPATPSTNLSIPSLLSNPIAGEVTSEGIPVAEATPLLIESTSGTFAQDTFTLSNAGSSPLQIQGVTPQFAEGVLPAGLNPEDVFVIEPSGGTVPPNGTLTVRVLLRDDLLPGTYGGTLAIATNDPTNPTIPVPITGSVELPRARLVASIRGAELPTNTPVWTPGDDILIGAELPGNQDQWLNGGSGDDLIFGNQGRDVLTGGPGQDTLFGGRGDDFLRGADGDDVLFGDRGDDVLQGNGGADSFVLAAGFGSDVILDFEDGRDRILLTSPLTFASLTLQDQGNSTQILSGTEVLATVVGVDSSLLTAADFAAL